MPSSSPSPPRTISKPPLSTLNLVLLLLVGVLSTTFITTTLPKSFTNLHTHLVDVSCSHQALHHLSGLSKRSGVRCPVQPPTLNRGREWEPKDDPAFRELTHQRLKGAVQIRTETFDDMPMNASDPRFDVFYDLEKYLRETFPLFHETMEFERVNVHGLLFTWKGSDPTLKPIILMAHQDVVPVNPSTLHLWTHPPFEGHMDEEGWIWGRGTTDMKGTLVSIMGAVEKLVGEGFKPERTILFSHGFDEEIGGPRGAKTLAEHIYQRYGPDSIAMIFDEGFTGIDKEYQTTFARLGTAEKGCLTIDISVHTEGGHSSRPPKHTAIGIISRLFVAMEDHPQHPKLFLGNPLLTYMECAAEFGEMDPGMKGRVRTPRCWPKLGIELGEDRVLGTFLKTTQAIDTINGGIKYNALPESVQSLTNYRIDFFESSTIVHQRLIDLLTPIATDLNMTLDAFGTHPNVTRNVIRLKNFGIVLEPAPLTPTNGAAWDLMGGTIKHLYPGAIVVPSGMTAFTDTQYYWDLSKYIYRFVPASLEHIKNYHTVDERIHIDAQLSVTRFYYKLIQNSVGWEAD